MKMLGCCIRQAGQALGERDTYKVPDCFTLSGLDQWFSSGILKPLFYSILLIMKQTQERFDGLSLIN